jgi:D-sedoheptulose 7-phosphate isomerase
VAYTKGKPVPKPDAREPTAPIGRLDPLAVPVRTLVGRYLGDLQQLLNQIDLTTLERTVEHLRRAREQGAMIYLAGNGGSAATATHVTNDLGKATRRSGRRPVRVMCLSDNVSWLTALGNDEGYDRVFAGQLENFATPGDVLVVISASGNSPNLVHAVELARARGLVTIGVLGFDGGRLKEMVDEALWLRSEHGLYGPVESAHVVLLDIVTACLIEDRIPGDQVAD